MTTERNAVIDYATLEIDDHGLLTAWIGLDYGDSGHQGFGGWGLYLPKSFTHHELKGIAGHFIFRVMEIAGVTKWDQLKGKTVRVRCTMSNVQSIGHIVKNDWFDPSEDFKKGAV